MAEIIPIAALGLMYLTSRKSNREDFSGMPASLGNNGQQTNMRHTNSLTNTNVPVSNYPVSNYNGKEDINAYSGLKNTASNVTDKIISGDGKEGEQFKSLTGDNVNVAELQHNNMKPFFGSNVTQSTSDNRNESILDNYTGTGSQQIQKRESAPLFRPNKDMAWTHGMPSTTSFVQERMRSNVTMKMNNTKPWEEIRVGPGLNQKEGTEGHLGFNSGMAARERWQDKTVDDLRVKTNPKMSFEGQMLGKHVGARGQRGEMGKLEKNRPDTFYENSSDRYFTTTGLEKKPTNRSEQVFRPETRTDTTREYFGANKSANYTGKYQEGVYQEAKKQQLCAPQQGVATKKNGWKDSDYGKGGYNILTNSRSLTGETKEMGIVERGMWAVITPVLDVLRPTLKQNVEINKRPVGNAGNQLGIERGPVWNPNDKPRTTIKEQTENVEYVRHGGRNNGKGYAVANFEASGQHRDTTNCEYIGNAVPSSLSSKVMSYDGAYNAHLNPNKEVISKVNRYNVGNGKIFSGDQNVSNLRNKSTNPGLMIPSLPKESSSIGNYGTLSGKNTRERNINGSRNQAELLNAFNNNPYSQSLNSYA